MISYLEIAEKLGVPVDLVKRVAKGETVRNGSRIKKIKESLKIAQERLDRSRKDQ